MPYSIRYTRATNHIEGIAERTKPGPDHSATTGVVGYYATSACPSLSRAATRMGTVATHDELATALEDARASCRATGRSLCKNCERAATRALEETYQDAQWHAMQAAERLDLATNTTNDTLIADAEAHAERTADRYADAAAAVGRCRIFKCEEPTADGRTWCPEHDDTTDLEPTPAPETDPEPARQRPAPGTYAAALAALAAGTEVAIYTEGGDTLHGAIAGTGSAGVMLAIPGRVRRQVAYNVVESFEYFDDETDGGVWVDPITDRSSTTEPVATEPAQCRESLMHNGIPHYCKRTEGHTGDSLTPHLDANGLEWWPGQAMPTSCPDRRSSAGCRQCDDDAAAFVAAASAGPDAPRYDCPERTVVDGIGYACVQHGDHAEHVTALGASWWVPEPVVAALDHTEPGKAVALITGSHGRAVHPQAWLSHAGGSWLLVDDYDGASYSVTGPDAERAVRAWAVLIGLDLDDLAVTVEYAGGPVSPPVPDAPEARSVALEWVRDREEVNVFIARGNAHTYRVTEHYDGASLVAYLRGKGGPVEAYRRRYTTRPGARRAAQGFEHRYGPMYAPAA